MNTEKLFKIILIFILVCGLVDCSLKSKENFSYKETNYVESCRNYDCSSVGDGKFCPPGKPGSTSSQSDHQFRRGYCCKHVNTFAKDGEIGTKLPNDCKRDGVTHCWKKMLEDKCRSVKSCRNYDCSSVGSGMWCPAGVPGSLPAYKKNGKKEYQGYCCTMVQNYKGELPADCKKEGVTHCWEKKYQYSCSTDEKDKNEVAKAQSAEVAANQAAICADFPSLCS